MEIGDNFLAIVRLTSINSSSEATYEQNLKQNYSDWFHFTCARRFKEKWNSIM